MSQPCRPIKDEIVITIARSWSLVQARPYIDHPDLRHWLGLGWTITERWANDCDNTFCIRLKRPLRAINRPILPEESHELAYAGGYE